MKTRLRIIGGRSGDSATYILQLCRPYFWNLIPYARYWADRGVYYDLASAKVALCELSKRVQVSEAHINKVFYEWEIENES